MMFRDARRDEMREHLCRLVRRALRQWETDVHPRCPGRLERRAQPELVELLFRPPRDVDHVTESRFRSWIEIDDREIGLVTRLHTRQPRIDRH
jgi:hypothetical protein